MILYFSGCGNSRYVAEELARLLDTKLFPILAPPLQDDGTLPLAEGETLGIVCPIYAWDVPRIVRDAVQRLHFAVKPAYCFLACTCGDTAGAVDKHFAKLLQTKGLHLDSVFSFVMPETYVNLPGFNLDTPESERRKIAAVRERLPEVARRIASREQVVDLRAGAMPALKSGLVNNMFYSMLITDKKFHVDDNCISCGKCAEVCQFHNIVMHDGRPRWQSHCTNCMACYHYCPKNAIHFGKATRGKGQYYFGHKDNQS